MENLSSDPVGREELNQTFLPVILHLNNPQQNQTYDELLKEGKVSFVHDEIHTQLQELLKCRNPSKRIPDDEYPDMIADHLKGQGINEYGVWVYYPWNRRIVHLLDEHEFVEVRTNRNQLKITKEEQQALSDKKIGIIGLSVGQSIALTMVMERICGEIRLADFDTAELSNLNRIRTGLHNMGINKTIIAAREILEIDPFMKVKVFTDGLIKSNIDEFFTGGGKIDLLVEVCDGIDIKIESRFKAKELRIPVVMDTNDRGMIDVERHDLEPELGIFHGALDSFFKDGTITVTPENRMPIILAIVDIEAMSPRFKLSMTQIGKTINTWPQLASSVVLGGAITTDLVRRVLLGEHSKSHRYYVDLDDIFK